MGMGMDGSLGRGWSASGASRVGTGRWNWVRFFWFYWDKGTGQGREDEKNDEPDELGPLFLVLLGIKAPGSGDRTKKTTSPMNWVRFFWFYWDKGTRHAREDNKSDEPCESFVRSSWLGSSARPGPATRTCGEGCASGFLSSTNELDQAESEGPEPCDGNSF
jgi:hypothetical protein